MIFAECAVAISTKNLTKKDIVNDLNNYKISNEAFKNHFSTLETKNKPIIRYILKEINNLNSTNETIISDSVDVHIEHILPQTKGEWVIYDHEDFVNKIGNLTLLGSEFNRKISNSLFDNKKKMYQKSEIKITQDLLTYSSWGTTEINLRQKLFTDYALTIW
ncbi:HNH endonuclease family protein [Exiguobacterium sp. SL14]|nr:HNH endonuclease family protein [Exiguobacterium sp. SL14]MCY1692428.1 HNH endonuclease family protein [Exiguobacterium sp. SL14]